MAALLTEEHRKWRVRIFAVTWLTYVAFYFCRRPFSSAKSAIQTETGWSTTTLANVWATYLIAYALGQFLASYMGTRLGPRRNVLLGMVMSILVTLAMGVTLSLPVVFGLLAVNGFAQATGWSGTVGTMASWVGKRERGRVMGAWSTNFTVGAITATFAMGWVLGFHGAPVMKDGVETAGPVLWRWCFYAGGLVLCAVAIQFYFFQRNRPEDVGLAPIEEPISPDQDGSAADSSRLTRSAWINIVLVGGFYFFSKFVRYAVWSWAAYFLIRNYGLSDKQANYYAIIFDVCGIPGVYLTGYLSDRYFGSRRAGVALAMLVGMMIATGMLLSFGDSGFIAFVALLGLVGFTLYGPDALLTGAGAIDIGGRRSATRATALISGIGSMGPVVQEVVIGRLYDLKSGDLGPIFLLIFGSATGATLFCAALVWRNRRNGRGI